ncbi:NAD(P)/FAD-dependent oxidoreductase [Kineococcus aurantiacus]|uniref:Glycine/D-amino acid oxidase-like deaminating enzyme n=1 Tax=Kineococcus aurantiacus TaxID=37633 RepID=A0A7Y9DM91_9ACTN|nr:FAD-dependent oxidoreductase [Kineococcus aurantiacus]NYD23224.1 glycine/D-amino acid oxidase-like deaminating enzyme [Kineococcus aurantiacus]
MSARTALRLPTPVPASPQDRSYWLDTTVPERGDELPALRGDTTARVAVVGGGLTGLWTAYRIVQAQPDADVVVLEAEFCGAGASGRNGGQVHSWCESLDRLEAVVGPREAVRLARASVEAIEELAALQDGGLDMDLRLDGWIWGASSRAQEGAWADALARSRAAGLDVYTELDADGMLARTGTATSYQGVVEERAGSLHPGKLVRGLRDLLLARGVRIHERTPVTEIGSGPRPVLRTPGGSVRAEKVLLATNAWAGAIPEINRFMYSVESQVVVTVPIPDRLDALGWKSGASICDSQRQVLYFQRTVDGRVLLGQGTGNPVFAGRLGARTNRNPPLAASAVAELHRLYPSLADVPIAYDWVGAIDCVATHVPVLGTLTDRPDVHYCVGWNGTALAQLPVVSRILASVLLGTDDEWGRSRLVGAPPVPVVREPVRFLGAQVVRAAIVRRNALERHDRRVDPLTRALTHLMPTPEAVPAPDEPGRTPAV